VKYNVIDSVWFNTIGIVRVRPDFGQDKFYIGQGLGLDQKADEQHIARCGMPYRPDLLDVFFSQRKESNVH
jgi:hypothetical protein